MRVAPVKTPGLFKRVFPNLIWEIPASKNVIYLTFDDGPTPEITEWTLDLLNYYKAQATFFCIGSNVIKYPNIYNRILAEGHVVGNHSHSHLKGWRSSDHEYLNDVEKASSHISSNLFRPPYGQIKPSQAKKLRELGYRIIMWNILSVDWDRGITPQKCADHVILNASSGDIVVFHDSLKAKDNMQYALQCTLEHFSKKGYLFKGIPELSQ